MCGLVKVIFVLACLLVIPATPQDQRDRRGGSVAKCKKPKGLEGDIYDEGCTKFTCTKAKRKFGIWVDRPNIDDCCFHQGKGYQMGDVIAVTNCTMETSLVCERREGLATITPATCQTPPCPEPPSPTPITTTTTTTTTTTSCQGVNLPANQTCFEGGVAVGTCASGLVCLEGVCKETGTCADPVFPNSLCYSADGKVADCCTGSYCVQPQPNINDSFCMSFTIAEGLQCGDTEAREYRGFCNTGLDCTNGVCTTTTPSTTTTTTTTPTATN